MNADHVSLRAKRGNLTLPTTTSDEGRATVFSTAKYANHANKTCSPAALGWGISR